MPATSAYSAFVSYASENREKADAICAGLEQRGLVCWMAPRDVRAGREYADEIILGLERSGAVVLVLSEAANTSVFVLREVERAVSKDINVIPVRIEEVTPSPGLELFISGTHWLDVWRGDWEEHMDRLVRDLGDAPPGTTTVAAAGAARQRLVDHPRASRGVYVAAGLALVAAVSGIAIWSFARDVSQPVETPVGRTVEGDGERAAGQGPAIAQEPATTIPVEQRTLDSGATRPAGTRRPDVTTARRPAADPAPPVAYTPGELSALREEYDDLSLRGGVIDDALNDLWEAMKPDSPRLDMVTHQRRLKTNLTRSRDAIAGRDAAAARRYMESARQDLAALEQFLNR